jgi:hypothetical protein
MIPLCILLGYRCLRSSPLRKLRSCAVNGSGSLPARRRPNVSKERATTLLTTYLWYSCLARILQVLSPWDDCGPCLFYHTKYSLLYSPRLRELGDMERSAGCQVFDLEPESVHDVSPKLAAQYEYGEKTSKSWDLLTSLASAASLAPCGSRSLAAIGWLAGITASLISSSTGPRTPRRVENCLVSASSSSSS